jgi:hypothetical protein
LRVFVAAIGEEAVDPLFDHLNLYGLSCFHLEPIYQPLQDPQQVFQIIFNYLIYLETRRFLLNQNKVFAPKEFP